MPYPSAQRQQNAATSRQRGSALLVLILIVAIAVTSTLYTKISAKNVKLERDRETVLALQKAKEALIAFSMRDLSPGSCTTTCVRPGDLPCPDTNNDGIAESSCGNAAGTSQQANRLGRLPWRTLGVADLRDGYGERLWYAVSNSYKSNTRLLPLNSNTTATISVRDGSGNLIYDGSVGNGVAAVVLAPGPILTRQDGTQQDRSTAQQNLAVNYLDNVAQVEDNANFIDANSNGFIQGPVTDANGYEILNDRLLAITRDEMAAAMEQRVLIEVHDALVSYYNTNLFYPYPAQFSDTTCLGTATLSNCYANVSTNHGRIPANGMGIVPDFSPTSILRGTSNSNWFQQNGWRELIHYAVAPICLTSSTCGSAGSYLTLNNALAAPADQKQVILLSAGRTLASQSRASNGDKTTETNYLEDENLTTTDNIYMRSTQLSNVFNDRAISIP